VSSSAFRRVQIALAIGCVALLAVACIQPVWSPKPLATPAIRKVDQRLPPAVGGVPLLDLAKHALGAAEPYSVSKPVGVRAVVTTQAALYSQVPAAGGATQPEYVVVLQGRFTCGACGTSTATTAPTSTTTTDPSTVHVSTMVLQLPVRLTNGASTGIAVGVGLPNMAKLGRVYDLDPYIRSLAGVTVPIGPFPG
jgi:hypothetical protein